MSVEVKGLTKIYGEQRAVDNISFQITKGEIVGFLGPNGAGKTTTMRMITQYLSPDAGEILLGGKPASRYNMRGSIGYLPEHNPLYDDMPVMEYLEFCGNCKAFLKRRLRIE